MEAAPVWILFQLQVAADMSFLTAWLTAVTVPLFLLAVGVSGRGFAAVTAIEPQPVEQQGDKSQQQLHGRAQSRGEVFLLPELPADLLKGLFHFDVFNDQRNTHRPDFIYRPMISLVF